MRLPALLLSLMVSSALAAETNLVPNPGMEGAGNPLPPSWDTVMIGNPVTFAADREVKHSGQQSARIVAPESARSYVRSAPIPVGPGEKIHASVWVKYKDVPEKMGAVILIAEWSGPDGRGTDVAKFDVAKRDAGTSSDWQQVQGTVTVPPNVANMRLRMGFSYSQGTCWWDDVTVTSDTPASLRIDLPTPRVTPAMASLPVTLLNRQGLKGPAKVALKVGSDSAAFDVNLKGEPVEKLNVPFPLGRQKGKVALQATLSAGGKQVASPAFEGQVPVPLILPPVSPTHWCVEDGPPHIAGAIDLSCAPSDLDRATLTLRVTKAADAGATVVKKTWSSADGTLRTGQPIAFDLTLPQVPEGEYFVLVDLSGPEAHLKAQQPWAVIPRRLAKVTLSEAGFPVHNGREFYPIGIFNGGRMEEQGKAGFTVTHAYNATRVFPGRDPNDQGAKDYLDKSLANGMMMVFMVPLKLAEEGDWEGFRRRIRMFRNHPGLLAWDEEEGLARGDWKAETRAKAYQIVKEEDPNHPFMVGDSRDVITKMGDRSNFFDNATMDLGMWWWYPFPLAARGGNALEGEEASKGAVLDPPAFLVKRNTSKPVWTGIQSYKKPGDSRYPTPAEYRLQAYYGIVTGAQGLMYYGGSVTGGMFLKPEESHWADVQKLVAELHSLEWAWLSPTVTHWETVGAHPVAGIVKRSAKGTVVVAVNRGPDAVSVELPIGTASGSAEVVGENRRVALRDGVAERFEPYGVHVYVVRE